MRKMILAAAILPLFAGPSLAMTDAECQTEWTKVDANNDGFISTTESSRFHGAMRFANKTIAPQGISKADFLTECKNGTFDVKAADAGAPLKGANSFTEGQAQGRAESWGFSSIKDLKKDGDGIWRGAAMKDGKAMSVAIDYKGNVVGN